MITRKGRQGKGGGRLALLVRDNLMSQEILVGGWTIETVHNGKSSNRKNKHNGVGNIQSSKGF